MISARQMVHSVVWTKRLLTSRETVAEMELLRRLLRPSDWCVDVGAHGGAWSAPLSRMVPEGKVLAFEALPYYAEVLQVTLRLLQRSNVEVINRPVLESDRDVQLVFRDPSGLRLKATTHVRGPGEDVRSETLDLRGITLDEALGGDAGRVRFAKLDIEGAELLALRGAERLIATAHPLFYIELNDDYCRRYGHSAADVFAFFDGRGYRGFRQEGDGARRPTDADRYSGDGNVWFAADEHLGLFEAADRS